MSLSRRTVLGGLLASVPAVADANLLDQSFRPKARPKGLRAQTGPSADRILRQSGLAAITGYVLRDLNSGRMVESHRPDTALPPASVTKAITALYGLKALGPGYRFKTQVAVSGPVVNGRVQGDLYLIGGGDPHLDTDGLAALAQQVAKAGIFGLQGRAYVVSGALPYHRSIDPGQPDHVGYNPSISGINLNFNRVHFEWKPKGETFATQMTARGTRFDPAVSVAQMSIVNRTAPVFDYRKAEGREIWSVSARALGKGGARWLPVREPATYAGEVFRILGAQYNLRLPTMRTVLHAPEGLKVIAQVESASFDRMLRAMMKYSTNLTAEVAGLRAAQALGIAPRDIAASSTGMTNWLRSRYGLRGARFVNHSGLSDKTRISAAEMVQVLDIAAGGSLKGLMKDIPLVDERGRKAPVGTCRVAAKTGTLNFTRGLAGYLDGQNGRRFAFAIFAADLRKRGNIAAGTERPQGGRRWTRIARGQEQALLRRWAQNYGI